MRKWTALWIGLAGAALTTIASVALHMPAAGAFRLAAIAGVAALGVGGIGVGLLFILRRRSIGTQVTVVALASVAAVAAGAMAAARSMFISVHDLHTLAVILLASGTIGSIVAFVLGGQVSSAGRALGAMARAIAGGEAPTAVLPPPAGEFAAL